MTTTNRIVSIEVSPRRTTPHAFVTAVSTRPDAGAERRWTARAVLDAMNRAERFYTQAPNGRRARVQRYTCPQCGHEHIRTHVSDRAIHDMTVLPQTGTAPRPAQPVTPAPDSAIAAAPRL